MPPRKRKISDDASASQPTKRVTRSSTRGDGPTAQAPTIPEKTESKSSNTRKPVSKAKPKSKITKDAGANVEESDVPNKKATPKAKPQALPDDSSSSPSSSTNYKILSIDSDLVKNPIQCHYYPSSTKSNALSLVFTHGAGGTLSASAVVNFCTGFSTISPVTAFQGSMNLASRVKGFLACIAHFQDGQRLVLGGRSMGARAAAMAAMEVASEAAKDVVELVLVSYPLQGPKDVRDQILLDLSAMVKVMFIVGDRDSMCPLELLDEVRGKMKAKSQLVVVRGADHGMHTKPAKLEKEHGEETGRIAAKWLSGDISDDVTYTGEEG
jgi:pimeloyl-ACP methyl ester carboxylesterase